MSPPPCHGGIASSSALPPVQHADAGRPEHLVRGEAIEVAAELAHVDDAVRHGLRAIEQHRHAVALRDRDEVLHRHDRAERVRHVREREQLRARADELFERREIDFAGGVDRNDLAASRRSARTRSCHGTMFAWCSSAEIRISSPGREARTREALRDEVDRLGRAAHEHDFLGVARVDEAAHVLARAFVGFGRALAERVDAAMHVGVIVLVVARDRLDHGARTLARRRVVQIHQRLAVDGLMQDREVAADRFYVERCSRRAGRGDGGTHAETSDGAAKRSSSRCSSAGAQAARVRSSTGWTRRTRGSAARAPRVSRQAARAQVKKRGRIELTGRRAVAAFHVVRVDLELGLGVDLGAVVTAAGCGSIGAHRSSARRDAR